MKLYLSSYRVPVPDELAKLVGKPWGKIKMALIPNAKDYYTDRVRGFMTGDLMEYFQQFGCVVDVIDLRDYSEAEELERVLADFDLVWARGGNTFMLQYEIRRSGFDIALKAVIEQGVVYGGDSAGALVAGVSLAGIESADDPRFAQEIIEEGMGLVPYVVLPHVDNAEFADAVTTVEALHNGRQEVIKLKDSQAVIFDKGSHRIVTSEANDEAVAAD